MFRLPQVRVTERNTKIIMSHRHSKLLVVSAFIILLQDDQAPNVQTHAVLNFLIDFLSDLEQL